MSLLIFFQRTRNMFLWSVGRSMKCDTQEMFYPNRLLHSVISHSIRWHSMLSPLVSVLLVYAEANVDSDLAKFLLRLIFDDWIVFDEYMAETTTRKFFHRRSIVNQLSSRSRSLAFDSLKWWADLSIIPMLKVKAKVPSVFKPPAYCGWPLLGQWLFSLH